MSLVGPGAIDHHQGEQDEVGYGRKGCLEAVRSFPPHRRACGQEGDHVGILPVPVFQCSTVASGPLLKQVPDGLAGGQGRREETVQYQGQTGPGSPVDGSQAIPGNVRSQAGRGV